MTETTAYRSSGITLNNGERSVLEVSPTTGIRMQKGVTLVS